MRLQGLWGQVQPLGDEVRFTPLGKDRLEASGLSFVAGPAIVMISSAEYGSDIKVSGAGSFVCFYKYLPFKGEPSFQWNFRGGNEACPKTAVFKQVDVPSERPSVETTILIPQPAAPPRPPESGGPRCGYYAIAYCSEDQTVARGVSGSLQAQLIDTNARNYYPNFRAGWFCVGVGPLPRDTAQSAAEGYKRRGYPTAYFKNSC